MMHKITLILAVLLLSSCAHKFGITNMEGTTVGTGEANEIGKKISLTVDGVEYLGKYVFSPLGRTGKAVVRSDAGDQMICDFVYDDWGKGLGTCEGKGGRKYSVDIFN